MTRNPDLPAHPLKLAAALMVGTIALTPVLTTPAYAFFFGGGVGGIVYDPRNHAENILSTARALEQINNQIAQIQNQAQMLMNDALNLANLPRSSLAQLQDAIGETQRLLADAQSLAFDVDTIEQAFAQDYGAASAQGDFDAMIA
ncbi:MAG: P-type conjugative transfer protein TrbJ, partial [Pseudomonadota bacterium]